MGRCVDQLLLSARPYPLIARKFKSRFNRFWHLITFIGDFPATNRRNGSQIGLYPCATLTSQAAIGTNDARVTAVAPGSTFFPSDSYAK
jgi:hypothetical protein